MNHLTTYPRIVLSTLCTLLLGLLLPRSGVAQQASKTFDLQEALGSLEQHLQSGVEVKFTLTAYNSSGGQEEQYSGTSHLQGERFKIQVPDLEVAFDGTTLRMIRRTERTYTLMTPSGQELAALSPLAYLKIAAKPFRLTRTGAAPGTIAFRFVPSDTQSPIGQIKHYEISFDQRSRLPRELDVYLAQGERINYRIQEIQPKTRVTQQSFTFAPQEYKSLEVVDLR